MDMETADTEEVYTMTQNGRLLTAHITDVTEEFIFGAAFSPDGELLAQQFEKDEERIALT